MKLTQWNRYRHETYKDRPADELPFIRQTLVSAPTADERVTEPAKAPGIKDYFQCVEIGEHEQANGTKVPCSYYQCLEPNCKMKRPIKEIKKNTGLLFRHMATCNPTLWRALKLGSKHSNFKEGVDGEFIQVRSTHGSNVERLFPLHLQCQWNQPLVSIVFGSSMDTIDIPNSLFVFFVDHRNH